MNAVDAVIVLEWLLTGLGAVVFLAAYGRPWRYSDRVMSWHLASVTAVAGMEAWGLLLMAVIGKVPLALVYGAGLAVVYWRLALLLRTRREAHRDRAEPEHPS